MRVLSFVTFSTVAASLCAATAQESSNAKAVEFEIAYTGEFWTNAGGLEDGQRYLDNVGLAARADLETLAGWRGATVHASLLYNNGQSLSELSGDSLVVSNIEAGVETLRLYEAWIEAPVAQSATLRLGLYDLNSEFDALDTSALFIGSAHGIGMDIAQTGANGPSIFPITGLAARLGVEITEGLTVRIAALEGVPGDLDDPAATRIDLDGSEGALIIGEFALETDRSRILLGAWGYTEEFETFTGRGQAPSNGIYLRGEGLLSQVDNGQVRGFVRLGIASGDVNPYNTFASAGLTFETETSGTFGVAVAHAGSSSRYETAVPDTASGETVVEITYARGVSDWLEIQPNIQFVSSPSANESVDDALALGIRFSITP